MKKCIAMLAVLVLLLTGCTSAAPETVPTTTAVPTALAAEPTETTGPVIKPRNETSIFISLPKEEDPHWAEAGQDLKMLLENLSYLVTFPMPAAR